jgi:hypothetical protein
MNLKMLIEQELSNEIQITIEPIISKKPKLQMINKF